MTKKNNKDKKSSVKSNKDKPKKTDNKKNDKNKDKPNKNIILVVMNKKKDNDNSNINDSKNDESTDEKKINKKNTKKEEIEHKEDENKIIGEICFLCSEEINSKEIKILKCGHAFHKPCLKKWLSKFTLTVKLK